MTIQTDKQTITAGYIRLTRDESLQNNLSAPAQRKGIEQYCHQTKLTGLHVFEETKAVGGDVKFADRPQGSKLLAEIEAGHVAHIVCRDLDRLFRDVRIAQDLIDLCRRHSVTIHTFSGPVSLKSASDRFAFNVRSAASQFEKDQVADRVRLAKQEMVEQGRWPGEPPPYSLISQARCRSELIRNGVPKEQAEAEACEKYPHRYALYIDEQEAETLRLIYNLALSGNGSRRIIAELNKRGLRTRTGGFWSIERLSRTLANPAAAGYLVNCKDRTSKRHAKLYKGNHPAVVTLEDWKTVQAIRTVNYDPLRGRSRNAARKYLLSGVIKCTCGSPMRGKSLRADRSGRYVCTKAFYYGLNAPNGCNSPAHTLNMNRVHDGFWKVLIDAIRDPNLIDKLYEATQQHQSKTKNSTIKSRQLAEQLAKTESQVAVWYRRHDEAKAESAREAAWRRILELTEQRKQLEQERDKTLAPKHAVRFTKQQIEKYLSDMGQLIAKHSPDDQMVFVQSLLNNHGLAVEMLEAERMRVSLRLSTPDASHPVSVDRIVFVPKDKTKAWMDDQQTPICEECGQPIKLLRRHFWLGLPKYHHKCWSRKLGRDRFKRDDDLITGGQVAKLLGMGRSNVTRWLRAGKLPTPVKKEHGALLWDRKSIDRLSSACNR